MSNRLNRLSKPTSSEFGSRTPCRSRVASYLDLIANSLEAKGALVEAEQIDEVANAVDAGLFSGHEPTKAEIEGLRRMISDKVRGNPGYLANKVEVTKKDHTGRFLKRTEERVRTNTKPTVKPLMWKEGPDGHWYLQNSGIDYSVEFVGDDGFLVNNKTGDKTLVPGLEVIDVMAMSGEKIAAEVGTMDSVEKLPVFTDARLKSAFNAASKNYTRGIYSDDTSWAPVHELTKKLVAVLPTFQLVKAAYDAERPNKSKTWTYAGAFETPTGQKRAVVGRIVASGAGSVEDPLDKYDLIFSFDVISPKTMQDSEAKNYVMSLVDKQASIIAKLDSIADSIESNGFLREASEVDAISNTLERMSGEVPLLRDVDQKLQGLKQPPEIVDALKTLAHKIPGSLLDELIDTLRQDIVGSGMREAAE